MKLSCTEERAVRGRSVSAARRTDAVTNKGGVLYWVLFSSVACAQALRQLQVVKEPAQAHRYLCRCLWNCLDRYAQTIPQKRLIFLNSTYTEIERMPCPQAHTELTLRLIRPHMVKNPMAQPSLDPQHGAAG